MTPDPTLADSVGNWLVFGVGVALTIWRRRQQNGKLAEHIDDSLAKQLHAIQVQVTEIKSSLSVTQTLVAIHSDHLKDGNMAVAAMTNKMDHLEETVLKGEALVQQFNDYLDRAKAGKLVETPIAPGVTKLKKENT
jgi:hypothetical protein